MTDFVSGDVVRFKGLRHVMRNASRPHGRRVIAWCGQSHATGYVRRDDGTPTCVACLGNLSTGRRADSWIVEG